MKIDLNNYLEKDFECPECHWKGKGSDLENGDFSELHFIFDFECPKCFNHIGSGQAEIVDADKYIKYLNGEIIDDYTTTNVYHDKNGVSIDFITHKNEIKVEYRLTHKDIKILKSIIVKDAAQVCHAFNCHRNNLGESLIHLLFNKENAFYIFKNFLQKNNIRLIIFDKIESLSSSYYLFYII